MVIKTYDAYTRLSTMEATRFTNFLFEHQEGRRATKKAIRKAIQYSTKEIPGLGGYVFSMEDKDNILALAVVNKTGMGDYIPENFMVFFVVHREFRNQGIEEKLLDYTLQYCKGDVAIHITSENQCPNKQFFEKYGFGETHTEMRLNR
ncbi:GNAT family N-acetyltransferase [Muricauda sp. MAR_2010_75]|jgi:GNAT superfamily N-acetyltransferase|uniref:GNAT family N-acetyltransferase n=1 Tax=Allomuricauda sp. MAR_2010_75 TaxID=1250232 RepID=UPI00068DF31C|nr:GNAT family N-acetyltransferase [Muricauda sp. MAR_2010_75]